MTDDAAIRKDFGGKLELACRRAKAANFTNKFLMGEVGVSADTWAKWKRGASTPSAEHICKVVDVFRDEIGIERASWSQNLEGFSNALLPEADDTADPLPCPSVDFRSRDRQPTLLLEQLRGYWAAYYNSTSRNDRVVVSRDLLEVAGVHKAGYISCQITDSHFTYNGFCFGHGGGLVQWFLEKQDLHNEVLSYMTTRPDRTPPVLLGVMTCTSGGVSTVAQLPAAARVAMVRLGEAGDLAVDLGMTARALQDQLRKHVPRYLEVDGVPPWITSAISNVIDPTEPPSALVVPAASGPSREDRLETHRGLLDELKAGLTAD